MSRLFLDDRWRVEILDAASTEADERLAAVEHDKRALEERLCENKSAQARQARLFMQGLLSEDVIQQEGERLKSERKVIEEELARVKRLYEEAAAGRRAVTGTFALRTLRLDEMTFTTRDRAAGPRIRPSRGTWTGGRAGGAPASSRARPP